MIYNSPSGRNDGLLYILKRIGEIDNHLMNKNLRLLMCSIDIMRKKIMW